MICDVAYGSDVLLAVKTGVFVVSGSHGLMVIVERYHFWLAVMALTVASWHIRRCIYN